MTPIRELPGLPGFPFKQGYLYLINHIEIDSRDRPVIYICTHSTTSSCDLLLVNIEKGTRMTNEGAAAKTLYALEKYHIIELGWAGALLEGGLKSLKEAARERLEKNLALQARKPKDHVYRRIANIEAELGLLRKEVGDA
jgi:hypothetical protein